MCSRTNHTVERQILDPLLVRTQRRSTKRHRGVERRETRADGEEEKEQKKKNVVSTRDTSAAEDKRACSDKIVSTMNAIGFIRNYETRQRQQRLGQVKDDCTDSFYCCIDQKRLHENRRNRKMSFMTAANLFLNRNTEHQIIDSAWCERRAPSSRVESIRQKLQSHSIKIRLPMTKRLICDTFSLGAVKFAQNKSLFVVCRRQMNLALHHKGIQLKREIQNSTITPGSVPSKGSRAHQLNSVHPPTPETKFGSLDYQVQSQFRKCWTRSVAFLQPTVTKC